MQWNKYPLCYATWIFIPLRCPPVCPSYPSNFCGASLPEAFRLSTSISACYSNSSCSSARSLFSAALSCNPYFFCHDCKPARSSFSPTCFRSGRCHDICLRLCSCSALLHIRSAWPCMKRLCTVASTVGVEYRTAKFGIRCRCIFDSCSAQFGSHVVVH